MKDMIEIVKCSHCGLEFNKDDTIPYTWKDIEPGKDFTWYYCKTCNKCFTKS